MRTFVKSRAAQSLLLFGLLALMVAAVVELRKFSIAPSDWIARVNGHTITRLDLDRQMVEQEMMIQQLIQQFEYEYGPQMGQKMAQMYIKMMGLDKDQREVAKRGLIQKALLDDAAHTLDLPVSDETVAALFASVDPGLLKQHLAQMGLTFADFQTQQKNEMLRSLLHQLVIDSNYSADFIVKNYYQSNQLAKQFSYVSYPAEDFVYTQPVSDAQLRSFFDEQNRTSKRYIVPEKRIGTVFRFDPSLYKLSVTPADIQAYYSAHKDEFQDKPAQLVVRRILFTVEKPEDTTAAYEKAKETHAYLVEHPTEFAQKAKAVSQDTETSAQGGLLAPFAKGTYEPEFEKAAFLLEKNGAVSGIVKTKRGFEVIQREDKKAQTFKSLQEVEPMIKARLQQTRFNNLFVHAAKDVVNKAGQDKQALESFVLTHGAKKQPVVTTAKDNARSARELFHLKEGGITSYQDGDVGFVVVLEKIEPTYTQDFETIKDTEVRPDFLRKEGTALLNKTVEADITKAKGLSNSEFKKAFPKAKQTGLLSPANKDALSELTNKGISAESLFQLEIPGSAIIASGNGEKYIVHLDAVSPINESDFAQKKEELRASAAQMESQTLFDGFVASLYRTATIKQN